MKKIILEKLDDIERQYDVRILYACESGSRAWGFASPDSDFDVRFIYVHKPDRYLSIVELRDVIELPIDAELDINGWELKKALRLFRKSNGPLYEWLQSPILYKHDESFSKSLRDLMPEYFSLRAGMHHYLSMAKGVFEGELSGESVRLKKYFYALRPVLAARWIAQLKSVPPMSIDALRKLLPEHFDRLLEELMVKKALVDERFVIGRQEALHEFIGESILYCQRLVPENQQPGDIDQLDRLFKKYIA